MDNFDLKKYLAEGRLHEDYNLNDEFRNSPSQASYEDVLWIIESYEEEEIENEFKSTFQEGEPISKEDYYEFTTSLMDDMSEISYIKANWINIFDEDVYDRFELS